MSELSPVAGNGDCIEGAASLSNRMHDEADEDDEFSKRRFLFQKIKETSYHL